MSGDAQIDLDYLQGRTRSLDFEYVFEIYSDGSVEITDVRSNADINKVIMKQREEQRNAGRYGNERQAFPGRDKTRHDRRTATYVRTGDNVVRRSEGVLEFLEKNPDATPREITQERRRILGKPM